MATLVLTALGDDRPGLVAAISGAINDHGGSWEQSHFSELAGKFAGIVVLSAPDGEADALAAALLAFEDDGLHVHVDRTDAPMGGGRLFEARAVLVAPESASAEGLREALEALADRLMVDVHLSID